MAKEDEVPSRPVGQEAAAKWIKRKWGELRPCPYCGGNAWTVTPAISLAPPVGDEGDHEVFPVTCNGCGNTVLVNANFPQPPG